MHGGKSSSVLAFIAHFRADFAEQCCIASRGSVGGWRKFEVPLASSSLEALVSGARPVVITGECRVRSVFNVLVLFHSMLWES